MSFEVRLSVRRLPEAEDVLKGSRTAKPASLPCSLSHGSNSRNVILRESFQTVVVNEGRLLAVGLVSSAHNTRWMVSSRSWWSNFCLTM